VETNQSWSEPKNSYWHDLKIFHGRQSDDPYWKVSKSDYKTAYSQQVFATWVCFKTFH
jgi:hypothetical protein